MIASVPEAVVEYPADFNARVEFEMTSKGFLCDVVVRLTNGMRYVVNFIDPVRLGQDLESSARQGNPYFTEPGLVVIPEVTRASIETAVGHLVKEHFFEKLKPLAPTAVNGQGS